uniref:Chaperone protein htpG n=1 Tax=Lygus hesperus TaxID=30085 RepID=A0A0A9W333_LYGHE
MAEVLRGDTDDIAHTTAMYHAQYRRQARRSICEYGQSDRQVEERNDTSMLYQSGTDKSLDELRATPQLYQSYDAAVLDSTDDVKTIKQTEQIYRARCEKQQ